MSKLQGDINKQMAEYRESLLLLATGGDWTAAYELLNHLEALEKERNEFRHAFGVAADTIKVLQAKVEAMEKQEPVAWLYTTNGEWDCYSPMKPPEDAYDAGSLMALYALPGAQAQPAQGAPDGWLDHAAKMAELSKKLREPEWCFESIRDMQRELHSLEDAAIAKAQEARRD